MREADEQKQIEQFDKIMKQKRLQYAQENPSHLKTKAARKNLLKFKQEMSHEVPEYLRELAESGIDIS